MEISKTQRLILIAICTVVFAVFLLKAFTRNANVGDILKSEIEGIRAEFKNYCADKKIDLAEVTTTELERVSNLHFPGQKTQIDQIRLKISSGKCVGNIELVRARVEKKAPTVVYSTGFFAEPYCEDVDVRVAVREIYPMVSLPGPSPRKPVLYLTEERVTPPCPDIDFVYDRTHIFLDVDNQFKTIHKSKAEFVVPEGNSTTGYYRLNLSKKGSSTTNEEEIVVNDKTYILEVITRK